MKPITRADVEQFVHGLGFCKPLFFSSGYEEFPVYCGGSCFLVRYRGKFYVITAKHCLRQKPEGIYVLTNAQSLIHIRREHFFVDHKDDSMWADVACLSTYPGENMPELDEHDFVDFDDHEKRHIFADPGDFLVLKAYPYSKCEMTEGNKFVRSPTMHIGCYGGTTESKHCHRFEVFYPKLGDPDGMSGAPVVKVEYEGNRGAFATVVGLVLQSSENAGFVRFVDVSVIMRMLPKMLNAPF